jgi:hypothetical protein
MVAKTAHNTMIAITTKNTTDFASGMVMIDTSGISRGIPTKTDGTM